MTEPLLPQGWYPDPAAQGLAPEALAPKPQDDPFYTYSGSKPLESIEPGTVLATRSIPYHILGIPTALKTTQLLYRSTSPDRRADRQRHFRYPAIGPARQDESDLVPVRL
jgi:hypothetical protein